MKKSINVPRVTNFEELERFATDTIECINWQEYPYKPTIRFRIAHNGSAVLVRFDVEEVHTKAVCTNTNGPVWEDSCVEFFVKEPNAPHYFNFETNCIGVGLAAKRLSRTECTHLSEEEQSAIVRRSSLPKEPCDMANGVWNLELEVPFAVLGIEGVPEVLEANLYKCGDGTTPMHFVSWSPIGVTSPDFHRPEWFGKLIFEQ